MKFLSFVLSACAAICVARALPNSPDIHKEHAIAGSTASNITVHFSAPCHRCTSSRNEFIFNVTIPATDSPCGTTVDGILVNGVNLQQQGQTPAGDNIGYQQLTLTSQTTYEKVSVDTVWLQSCRREQIASLTLTIVPDSEKALDHDQHQSLVISYKHGLAPEVDSVLSRLGLENLSAESLSTWIEREAVEIAFSISSSRSSLETEYARLKDIKHQILQLSHEYHHQELKILSVMNEDFRLCNGVVCYVQTAFSKIPDLFELASIHFKHSSPKTNSSLNHLPCNTEKTTLSAGKTSDAYIGKIVSRTSSDTSIPTPNSSVGVPGAAPATAITIPTPVSEPVSNTFTSLSTTPPPSSASVAKPSHLSIAEEQPSDSSSDTFNESDPPSEDEHPKRPPWSSHDRPHPDHDHEKGPSSHHDDGKHSHRPYHKHRRPKIKHPAPRHKHFRLILGLVGGVSSTLIVIAFCKLLLHYCMNPRVRADRLAHMEECRNKRAYRRAARQYRFRQLLGRFRVRGRRGSDSADYEEKRAMLRRSQGPSEEAADSNVIQADINSLRRAHEIVSELVRAEEGRSRPRMVRGSSMSQQPDLSRQIIAHEMPVGGQSDDGSMSTLPPYAPPPPRYSMELSRDTEVVDGFRYTPSNSAATATSSASSFVFDDESEGEDSVVVPPTECESSIVDCRSRISVDTDRTVDSGKRNRKSLELAGERFRRDFR